MCWPRVGEANPLFSVYSTLCRWTATSNFINAIKRQRNLGLIGYIYPDSWCYHRHSNSGPPFFLIWSLPWLWYGSLSGSISLSHLSIFYNISCYNSLVLIWGRCNLKRSRRTVIFLPVYKISSLKITPPKTPNSGQSSYPLPNIVSFLFEKNRLEFWFRSHDFSFNLFPVWQPYCWRFWSAIVPIHKCTSTINTPKKGAY